MAVLVGHANKTAMVRWVLWVRHWFDYRIDRTWLSNWQCHVVHWKRRKWNNSVWLSNQSNPTQWNEYSGTPLIRSLMGQKEQARLNKLRLLGQSIKLTCQRHFNVLNFERVAVLTGWNYKGSTVWDFKMWLLGVLTGHRINVFFNIKRKCMAVLLGWVITRWLYYWGGRKTGFYCMK